MKEIQGLLRIVSDGLKTLAQGVEALADMVDDIAKTQTTAKPKKAKPTAAAPKSKAVKKSIKTAPKKKMSKQATATDTVFKIIGRSKKGISSAAISDKAGYDRKKVANIIYRLGKQGKIKSVAKGVYVKS